jgi:HEAT repeat protein
MKPQSLLSVVLLAALCAPAAYGEDAHREDALYADGTRAINDGRWADAESIFNNIAQQRGGRAEAALYWKAYAENKEGKPKQALDTCNQLRLTFPHGKWLNECGALEIDIRGKSNDPLPPEEEQDEELKLLALNALMQQDESKSLPIIQQILSNSKSEKLKSRALFVLAQSHSPQGQALLDQIARGLKDEALQRKAIEMMAVGQGRQAAPTLADIYRQTTNEQVKSEILHTYLIIGTPDPLVDAARHETDPKLVRSATHTLGAMGATQQLATLYQESNSQETKADVIDSLVASGKKGADTLASIAGSEKDPVLQQKAIRSMGVAGGSQVAPVLVAMYGKSSDPETRKAVIHALFVSNDSHDLVELARNEKDPGMRKMIVQQLSVMNSKEATDYMLEILNK